MAMAAEARAFEHTTPAPAGTNRTQLQLLVLVHVWDLKEVSQQAD